MINNIHGIPAELRELPQWVIWRTELRDGGVKPTKVPYRVDDPSTRASSTSPSSWGSFDQALHAVRQQVADGVGFVFTAGDPYCGVDLDRCRRGHTIADDAAVIVRTLNSYTHISAGGRGLHIIVRARLDGHGRRRGPVEVYDRGRYFAMTARQLPHLPGRPMPRQAELEDVLRRFVLPQPQAAPPTKRHLPLVVDDERLLERAMGARNGGLFRGLWEGRWEHRYSSQSEADAALCRILAFWAGGDVERVAALFARSGLYREKWDRLDYRARTLEFATGGC